MSSEEEVSIWTSSLTKVDSRSKLESSWENERSYDELGNSSWHAEIELSSLKWSLPKVGGSLKNLIVFDSLLRLANWESFKNGNKISWHGTF